MSFLGTNTQDVELIASAVTGTSDIFYVNADYRFAKASLHAVGLAGAETIVIQHMAKDGTWGDLSTIAGAAVLTLALNSFVIDGYGTYRAVKASGTASLTLVRQ